MKSLNFFSRIFKPRYSNVPMIGILTEESLGLNISGKEIQTHRFAARSVVLNDNDQIAMFRPNIHKIYRLPGGGIEFLESAAHAAKREAIEEIGAVIELSGGPIGKVIEMRCDKKFKQTNVFFVAKFISIIRKEKDIEWFSLTDAISVLSKNVPNSYKESFISARELAVLNFIKNRLTK